LALLVLALEAQKYRPKRQGRNRQNVYQRNSYDNDDSESTDDHSRGFRNISRNQNNGNWNWNNKRSRNQNNQRRFGNRLQKSPNRPKFTQQSSFESNEYESYVKKNRNHENYEDSEYYQKNETNSEFYESSENSKYNRESESENANEINGSQGYFEFSNANQGQNKSQTCSLACQEFTTSAIAEFQETTKDLSVKINDISIAQRNEQWKVQNNIKIIEKLKQEQAAMKTTQEGTKTQLETLTQKNQAAQKEIAALKKQIADMDKSFDLKIQALTQRLETQALAALAAMKKEVQANTNKLALAATKSDLKSTNTAIATLTTKTTNDHNSQAALLKSLRTDVNKANTGVTAANSYAAGLNTRITTNTNSINGFRSKISDHERRVTYNRQQVDKIWRRID